MAEDDQERSEVIALLELGKGDHPDGTIEGLLLRRVPALPSRRVHHTEPTVSPH